MQGRFPDQWVEELRSQTDIVQLISSYMPLKRNGKKYWGLCPFHHEKTPSFSVDSAKQMYYCFGCKAAGSIFNFVMEMEHLTYPEAIEYIAEKENVPLPEKKFDPDYEKKKTLRERLLAANKEAARYYNKLLYTPKGKECLDYLKNRGLSDDVIRMFGLGASTDEWDDLTKYLLGMGFTEEEISLAGLCVVKEAEPGDENHPEKKRRVFDMFRQRAMFPIIDKNGNVIAFGGRSVTGSMPKYLNTAETLVFNKRNGVYAANLLNKERALNRVVLVEGYMDVVSLTQFGVKGVCATLGTALTFEQAKMLGHYSSTVYLSYDGDSAGQHAILRGLDILSQAGMDARVLDFPDGLDPDEFIRRDGIDGFNNLPVLTPVQYRLRRAKSEQDLSTQEGRTQYAKAAAKIIAVLEPVELENCLRELELQTGFSRDVLNAQVLAVRGTTAAENTKSTFQKKTETVQRNSIKDISEKDSDTRGQEILMTVLATTRVPLDIAGDDIFTDKLLKRIYQRLKDGASPAGIVEECEDDSERARAAKILTESHDEDRNQLLEMAKQCLNTIRTARIDGKITELKGKVLQASAEDKRNIISQIMELQNRKNELQKHQQ